MKVKSLILIFLIIAVWSVSADSDLTKEQLPVSRKSVGRCVKVVSLCFYQKSLSEIVKIIDAEGAKGCDIIVLPETWLGQKKPETLEGETVTTLAKLAKKHHIYIASGIDRQENEKRFNSCVLIDREGKVIGVYDKVYPYWEEYDLNPPVHPGWKDIPVFTTDFGRIGFAICFDANFSDVWRRLSENGAEIVFWPSAYSAGSQLQAYSLLHHYYIVTSTQIGDCQAYDITGKKILDKKEENITIARITLDLDRGIYHDNFNIKKRDKLLQEHGDEITQEIYMPREAWFVLKAKKPGVSARELARSYGLEELRDYKNRSQRAINDRRGFKLLEEYNTCPGKTK